jgi:signal transduction histidine kinase
MEGAFPLARRTPTSGGRTLAESGGSLDDVLAGAAERVALRYSGSYGSALLQDLDTIVRSVNAARAGAIDRVPSSLRSESLPLLRALRTEVLREWPEEGPSPLALMQAMEVTQDLVLGARVAPAVEDALTPSSRTMLREVAHMLRSPLGSIVILSDALRDQGESLTTERRNKQLAIIYRAALGVAEFAGSILSLVGDGEVEPPAEFSARRILEVVADVAAPVAQVRESEISVHVADDSRAVAPEAMVGRALLGMTLRAVLRTRGGTVRLEATRDSGGRCAFAVVARGLGVTPEPEVARLLQVFHLDPETQSYTLSQEGLALVATERLIRGLGSELRVEAGDADELRLSFSLGSSDTGAA